MLNIHIHWANGPLSQYLKATTKTLAGNSDGGALVTTTTTLVKTGQCECECVRLCGAIYFLFVDFFL